MRNTQKSQNKDGISNILALDSEYDFINFNVDNFSF